MECFWCCARKIKEINFSPFQIGQFWCRAIGLQRKEFEPMTKKIKHITRKRFDNACNRLFEIQSGLDGLSSLFEFQSSDACFNPGELSGMGQLLKLLARELSTQEDILRCGYDSRAVLKIDKNKKS